MSRIARVVGLGVISGLLFGAGMWYFNDDIWAGVFGAVFFGVAMGIVMRRQWGSRALEGLTRDQRRHVIRTMRRGEAMDDMRLARPLIEQANAVLAMPHSSTFMRITFGLMFALGAAVTILNIVDGEVPRPSGPFLMLFSSVFMFVVVPMSIRERERVARSRDATESRWGQETPPASGQ